MKSFSFRKSAISAHAWLDYQNIYNSTCEHGILHLLSDVY